MHLSAAKTEPVEANIHINTQVTPLCSQRNGCVQQMALIKYRSGVKGEKERTEPERALMTDPIDTKAPSSGRSLPSLYSFFASS